MLKKTLLGLLILVALVYGFVQWKVYQINSAPQAVSYETLSQQPDGVEGYITTADGTKLRTLTAGDSTKPTVVLAHGFGGTIRDWNLIFNQLVKDGYHVVAFEQRGHNKSTIGSDGVNSKAMAGDYKTVLEHFNVQNAVLVGHSMGGFLSIRFMIDYPEVVKKRLKAGLIMASFAGDVSKDNAQNKIQIPLITSGWINTIFNNKPLATIFSASLLGKPNQAVIQTSLDNFKLQNYASLVPILQAFVDENYYPHINEIAIPCTILVGTADKTTPAFHSETLAKDIPNAKLIKIEGAGHLLNWEAPQDVVTQIEALAKTQQ
jgi:non-heme chloroperoxidase